MRSLGIRTRLEWTRSRLMILMIPMLVLLSRWLRNCNMLRCRLQVQLFRGELRMAALAVETLYEMISEQNTDDRCQVSDAKS